MYTTGSIVVARVGRTETIARVDKVDGDNYYCTKAVTSYNGEGWVYTLSEYPEYEGETAETIVRLAEPRDFDVFVAYYPKL